MFILVLIWMILAAVAIVSFGGTYLQASQNGTSAIHELGGVLGLGVGALLLGQAVMMGALNNVVSRMARIEHDTNARDSSALLARITPSVRAGAMILRTIADIGMKWGGGRNKRIVQFVAMAIGEQAMTAPRRDAVLRWMIELPDGEPAVEAALEQLPGLDAAQRADFQMVAKEMAKGGRKGGQARQQALLDAAWRALEEQTKAT